MTAALDHWLAQELTRLPTELEILQPSAWAEKKRYLPPSVANLAGNYRFDVAPYLREIVDCLSVDSPVREVTLQKGVQIGGTVGVLENGIGYFIEHVKHAPLMLVTADADMAATRIETYIVPMLQHSNLLHLIKSSDENNPRKTGSTAKRIEWVGGGVLIPFGAQNANKLRQISIRVLLRDEIDGWPDRVGKDGDPLQLSADRTAAYAGSQKIVDISTPTIRGQSKIETRFKRGDQRRYFVRCLHCGHAQTLRWRRTNRETGEITGMTWTMERNRLVPDSVRYLCGRCAHPHMNEDKARLLAPANGAEWRPTAEAASPDHRSYHLSSLYAPIGMQTWSTCVYKWLDAWDHEHDRPKDMGVLQTFYNNVLGETFELRGEKLRFDAVSSHRRHAYSYGEIPNHWAVEHCASPVLLLTCAVDVHKDNLAVAVFGWCRDRRAILIDYWRFEGDTWQLDDAPTWGKLRELIEQKVYIADDGKRYRIALTLVDSGYISDHCYRFCSEYESAVFPIRGRDTPTKNATLKEFSAFTTPMGTTAYAVTVDLYKDRWSAALRRNWDGVSQQPPGHFNAPIDATDAQLKELTVEVKRERIDKTTGRRLGFEWHRGGANNELWDLIVYNSAALDLVAWDVCRNQMALDFVNWPGFWDQCEGLFFTND